MKSLFLMLFTVWMILLCGSAFAQSSVMPHEYRLKVDSVDVSKAPDIRIYATFLDKTSHPVSPKKITMVEVIADGDTITTEPKLSVFKDSDLPLDLAIIVPLSKRFTKKEVSTMQDSIENVIKQAGKRENDRVAGFFDDGRGVQVKDLESSIDDVIQTLKDTKPQAQPSFLYSSLDKAITELSDPAKMRKSRRAIILVTDAYDSSIYRAEDVKREVYDAYKYARENNIQIYVVMYKPVIQSLVPLFEGLSRKTGGTYREVNSVDKIATGVNDAWGEIFGEMVLEFKHEGLRENQDVIYNLEVTQKGGLLVKSQPYKEIRIEKLQFNQVRFLIICGIVLGVIILIVVIVLIVRHIKLTKEAEAAELEEQKILEGIERGEVCPKCRRTMLPEWKECMFCAQEAAAEIQQNKADQEKKKAEENKKQDQKKDQGGGRVCSKCGRTMMPQWKECMFCKAGIGGDGGAQKGLAPTGAEKDKNTQEPANGARICPICHRPMKPHWTFCLYCEADAGNRDNGGAAGGGAAGGGAAGGGAAGGGAAGGGAPGGGMKPAMMQQGGPMNNPQGGVVNPNAAPMPAPRICPTCGRPMKPHWDICLYCEANRMR